MPSARLDSIIMVLGIALGSSLILLKKNKKEADAQNYSGLMYYNGSGVPKDDVEAVKWYRKAANQGYADAQCSLGFMYLQGRGVPRDDVEAYAWVSVAAAVSQKQAQEIRDGIIQILTPEEKARAQKRSTELFNEIEARKKAAGK